MAINIQNIIDQITAKAAAADSTDTADYLLTLSKATLAMNNATGVIEYRAKSELPTVDSSTLGNFAYIAGGYDVDSVYGDSYAGFYYAARIGSNDSGWDRIRTGADSDADAAGSPTSQAQGSISGYTSGGITPAALNVIDKFSFTSDGNATDVGDITVARYGPVGQSSTTSGYTSGGRNPSTWYNVIDKFPFSTDANATDVGNLTVARDRSAGSSSTDYGYTSAGYTPPTLGAGAKNYIDKFPFSADGNATDVGDTTVESWYSSGHSSTTHGYVHHGYDTPPSSFKDAIDKFPFASDANATLHASAWNANHYTTAGTNSYTHGYAISGVNSPYRFAISKFSFSSDATSEELAIVDWTSGDQFSSGAGQSASGYGYFTGGQTSGKEIQKHNFATDATTEAVGDLSVSRYDIAGQQV